MDLRLLQGPLDRRALMAYFLGGVLPLGVLVLVLRLEAPHLLRRPWILVLLVSIVLLSLGAFLALRRTMERALQAVGSENRTLKTLLRSARELVTAERDGQVAETLARAVTEPIDATHGFFVEVRRNGTVGVRASFGRRAESMHEALLPVARQVAGTVGGTEAGSLTPVTVGGEPGVAITAGGGQGWRGVLFALGPAMTIDDPAHASAASALATLGSVSLHNARLREAQRNFFSHVTNLLVTALDTHVGSQEDHSRRVARLANVLGRRLQFDEDRLYRLHFASLLHDIGMLRIPQLAIGRDSAATRRHPELGAEILDPIELWKPMAQLVLHHHEWWDGTGYPRGLAGETIPLESRIISIAEAYDSMTAESSYQSPLPRAEALNRIDTGAGTQFDPDLARIFLELARAGALD